MNSILAGCLLLLTVLHQGHGDGHVAVRFLKYENPGGRGANGHCCDGKWGFCGNKCDHMFTICLDEDTSETGIGACPYGRKQTGAVENHDTITFGSKIRDTANPIIFNIRGPMPGALVLKVDVWDKDKFLGVAHDHDHVELLRMRLTPSEQSVVNALPQNYNLNQRTRLSTEITFECADDYYTATCDVYCDPPRPDQHYFCDDITGRIVCEPGWMGQLCGVKEETCEPGHCANGGTCLVEAGKAVCQCPDPFQGLLCDAHACDAGCAPGWCIWWSDGHMCQCPEGFEGIFHPDGMTCEVATTTSSTTTTSTTTTTTTTTTAPRPSTTAMPFPDREDADCDRLADNGYRYLDGVYPIHAGHKDPFPVYCDMTHDGAGWTVIQRRRDGQVDFDRSWEDYQQGFGEPGLGEHWLGLDNLYHLTNQRSYRLQIKMQVGDGTWRYAGYDHFRVENEANQYRLHVDGFNGNAGNALEYLGESGTLSSQGMPFTTRDHDNDQWEDGNCAQRFSSGWWFNNCFQANLNGVYVSTTGGWPPCGRAGRCVAWKTIPDFENYSLSIVEMKVLPNPRF